MPQPLLSLLRSEVHLSCDCSCFGVVFDGLISKIACKAKFDIWGCLVLSGENKPMRNRSLEQR